jgi:signal transduction histidine kinase
MTAFFVMSIAIICLLMTGAERAAFTTVNVIWNLACYIIAYKFPDIVTTPGNPAFPYIDGIGSFLMSTLFIAGVIVAQNALYDNEKMQVRRAALRIRKQTDLRALTNDIAADLLNVSEEDFNEEIVKCLGALATFADADRAYIFENTEEDGALRYTSKYSWLGRDEYAQDTISDLYSSSRTWNDALSHGRIVNGPIASMREDVREMFEGYGIKSILVIPIFIENEFAGFLSFDNLTEERVFSDDETNVFKSAAMILYSAVIKNNVAKSLIVAREEALTASRAKGDFLSNMSHEIRTPMNAIIGMIDIAKKTDSMEQKDRSLEKMADASEHLLSIINDILDISKIEANKLQLAEQNFSFRKMINRVVTVSSFQISRKEQVFEVNLDENIPDYLYGDDQRLAQVITNFMSNAIKFTPEGGTITLETELMNVEESMNKIRITIRDTGIGITEEQRRTIFYSFEQAESNTSRKFGGTGLGLAISKRIVEMMSGEIVVESELGKGASFSAIVPLPLAEGDAEAEADEAAEAANIEPGEFSGLKLLLAEDVEINREIVITLLEPTGIDIDSAVNGIEAVRLFDENPEKYALILMDMQMPEMDGLEATRKIRALDKGNSAAIPILALTANVFSEDIAKCLESGMNSHIGKPLDLSEMLEKLRHYMGT